MKTVKDIEEASRQVLMAGLGICGLGKDYAVHKLDVLMEDLNGLVNSLLLKGEQVEDDLHINERMQAIKDRRIARIRKKLGFNSDPQLSELDQLSHKLDMLTKVVDKLAEQKAQKQEAAQKADVKKEAPAKKPTARKATAAKTATNKSTASKTTRTPRAAAASKKTTATKSTRAKSSTTTAAKTTARKKTTESQTTSRRRSTSATQSDADSGNTES